MERITTKKAIVALAITAIAVTAWIVRPARLGNPESIPEAKAAMIQMQAAAIDGYFAKRKMPLAGYGLELAKAADENGLDWRLLPAIAVRESSGGLQACGANVFGWASCKRTFKTIEEGIQTVARHLGGNVTSTAAYYRGKSTRQILEVYNPPSIVPDYARQVETIMDAIAPR